MTLHIIQQQLLRVSQEHDLSKLSLRETGKLIGVSSPQKVKHHLSQLERKGLLRIDRPGSLIRKENPGWAKTVMKKARLLVIPIVGAANAGAPTIFAEENTEGYLRVSDSLVGRKTSKDLFAVKVDGPSMNRSRVGDKFIEDGDYVIVDSTSKANPDKKVVLSVIDGVANIKRYLWDKDNQQIVLVSESTKDFAPIYIHEGDDYEVNGVVIQVIKKPKV